MAGFNYAQNIIGLKKSNGDIHELELEVAQLSASVLSIELDVANLSASVLTIGEKLEDATTYSTSEKVVGKWVDGSDLYEKTINFGALPNSDTKSVAHNISNVAHIWIYDGFAENSTSGFTNQLNLSGGETINNQFYFGVTKTEIRCVANSDRTSYDNCYITLRYTKVETEETEETEE